ncbi:MAG: hypothetical protein IJU86_04045 [Firmicutes bacterium]|nr:hypothetical protein [Bacillota bacterium]
MQKKSEDKKVCEEEKTCLKDIPKAPFQAIANFLNMRETVAISFANKNLNANAENRRTEFKNLKNLFDCVTLVMGSELDDTGVIMELCSYHRKFTDYATGKEVTPDGYSDNSFKIRVLEDFANTFIKTKNDKVFFISNMKIIVEVGCLNYSTDTKCEKLRERFKSIKDFYKEFFKACGFELKDDILSLKYIEKNDLTKHIQNYKQITGKSYKSIYEHIKNNPDPEKPERENYIKAYEELNK